MVLPGQLGGRVGRRRDPSRTAPPEGGAVRLSPGEQTVGAASAKEEWQRSHGRRATAMCGVGGRPRWEVDDAQGSGVPERGGARRACAGIAGGSRWRRHGNRVRPDRRLSGDGGWYPAVPRLDWEPGRSVALGAGVCVMLRSSRVTRLMWLSAMCCQAAAGWRGGGGREGIQAERRRPVRWNCRLRPEAMLW
jgi:hypothetical protein